RDYSHATRRARLRLQPPRPAWLSEGFPDGRQSQERIEPVGLQPPRPLGRLSNRCAPKVKEGESMRARIRLPAIPVAVLLCSAAALAQAEDKATDLKPFDALQINGCFETRLEPGKPARAVVSATADQLQRIRVEQDGKRVRIGFAGKDDYNICRDGPIRVTITASFAATDS